MKKKLGQIRMSKNNKKASFIAGFTMDQNIEDPRRMSSKSIFEEVIIGDEDIKVRT